MNEGDIRTAGGLLAGAWRENRRIDRFSGVLVPPDRAAATAIQDEMAKQIGEEVVGWKVGGELVGRIFEPNLFSSPASLPVERFRDTLVEVELGFRLLADFPARSEPYGGDEVVEAAVLVPTFEFVASRFAGEWPNPEIESEWLLMAADNAVVAGVVVGAELPDWKEDQAPRDPHFGKHRRRCHAPARAAGTAKRPRRRAGVAREPPLRARNRPCRRADRHPRRGHRRSAHGPLGHGRVRRLGQARGRRDGRLTAPLRASGGGTRAHRVKEPAGPSPARSWGQVQDSRRPAPARNRPRPPIRHPRPFAVQASERHAEPRGGARDALAGMGRRGVPHALPLLTGRGAALGTRRTDGSGRSSSPASSARGGSILTHPPAGTRINPVS